jgi:hypothetical protein
VREGIERIEDGPKEVKKDRRFYRNMSKALAKNKCPQKYKGRAERMYNEGKAWQKSRMFFSF